MKKICLIIIAGCFCLLFSCQREIDDYIGNGTTPIDDTTGGAGNTDTSNALIGSWNFDSTRTQNYTNDVVIADGITDTTISTQDYGSYGNNGTLTIDANYFKSLGLTYSISTTVHTTTYVSGGDTLENDLPFAFYLPPTSSTSKYQLISSDSVYFPEGGFISADTSSTPSPYGLLYKIDGNKLTFTQHIAIDTAFTADGVQKHDKGVGTSYIYFHKN